MKRLTHTLLFLIWISSVGARNYYFRHYQNEDGLPHNTVLSCIQDKEGFMWFGTKDGLSRFDGHQFKTFYSISPSNIIPNNAVGSLCEDNEGRIWMATFNGLYYYNKQTNTFNEFYLNGELFNQTVIDIKMDTQGRIWFTANSGLYRHDTQLKETTHFSLKKDFIPQRLCITRKGELWVSSSEGKIYKYIDSNNRFQSYQILTQEETREAVKLHELKEDAMGRIFICTNKGGVRVFNPFIESTQTLFVKDNQNKEMDINDILINSNGDLWIGTDNGLYQYNDNAGLSLPMQNTADNPYSLSDKGIRSLYKDREGGIWIGTFYGGLNYLSSEEISFEKFIPSSRPGHIQGKIIRPICGDNQGKIWIGSEDGGLCCYNPSENTFTNYPLHSNIQTLMIDGNHLWIGSYINGIYWMDLKNHQIIHQDFQAIKNDYVVSFLQTRDQTIYVGTVSGIYRYNAATHNLERLNKEKLHCFVHCLYESSDGTIWIGTYGQGLYAYYPKNKSYVHYSYDAKNPNSISTNIITSITEDSRQQLWITTEGNGFCKINKDNTFSRYMLKEHIPYRITCAIVEDAEGYLWITSTKGLIRFDPQTADYIIYKKSNGLTDNQFSYNSKYTDSNGKMYLGTINGMIAFNPLNLKRSQYMPDVFITGFTMIGSDKELAEEGKSILNTKKMTLSHNQASFCIEFTAPSFTTPEQTKYRYTLEGYDQTWNYLTDYRKIYYTNVSPGKYILKVAISDNDNDWTTHQTSIELIIAPPFEKSRVAYIIYTLLLTAAIIWAYRIYIKRKNRQQQQIIEKFETQKEKELYNAKIQFFTNITHEVRTPLTLIKVPLDKVLDSENLPEFLTNNLSIMKRNVDRLLDLINQLLDFRKTEMEMLRLSFVRIDICTLVRKTVTRFIPSIEEAHKKVVFHIPEEPCMLAIDQEIITKILSNLLTNALKYSKDYIEISIEMSTETPSMTYIRISNNGELIPENQREDIFKPFYQIEQNPLIHTQKGSGLGLSLSRSLAKLHHGELFVDHQVTSMNSFVLALLNTQEENIKIKNTETIIPSEIIYAEEQTDNNRFTILIVDDEKEMSQFIANELSESYDILTAYDGKQAIGFLEKEQVHLVVSDVLMPVMDGYALCNYIKSSPEHCHIPVVLLTASVALNSRITGLKLGADGYIEKPFSTKLLLEQINNIFKNKELACKNFISTPLSNYRAITVNKIDDDFMKQMHAFILSNLSNPNFCVEELASSLNMSMSTLFRKVKAITNLGPNEYIRLYKLKKAAQMLAEEKYKINEVAYIVGFSSSSYFSTCFQKQFNLSPSEFIKQQKSSKH